MRTHGLGYAAALAAAIASAACGDFVRESQSPSQLVMVSLQGASGAEPDRFGGTLLSDVVTAVDRTVNGQQVRVDTVFNDLGQAVIRLQLRDPGQLGTSTAPSLINQVTITRYRVTYRRADGRNTPGVDVPHPFDGAVTFTVPLDGDVTANFDLVRHSAKLEPPLRALVSGETFISTITEVVFYGRDQAGNAVSVSGSLSITFGNFADPE
jgi:hypothetical protein